MIKGFFAVMLVILKAVAGGVGLGFGLWIAGFVTRYLEYYLLAWLEGNMHKPRPEKGKTYFEELMSEWFMKPFHPVISFITNIKSHVKEAT